MYPYLGVGNSVHSPRYKLPNPRYENQPFHPVTHVDKLVHTGLVLWYLVLCTFVNKGSYADAFLLT